MTLPPPQELLGYGCLTFASLICLLAIRRAARAEHDLDDLVRNAPTALLVLDPPGRVLAMNHELASMWGVDAGQVQGRPLSTTVDNTLWESIAEHELALIQGEPLALEFVSNRDDDGTTRHYRGSVKVATNRRGKLERYIIHVDDLTQEYNAKRAIAETATQLRRVLVHSSDLVFGVNATLKVAFVNKIACQFLGAEEAQIVGQPLYGYVKSGNRSQLLRACQQATKRNLVDTIVSGMHLEACGDVAMNAHIVRTRGNKGGFTITFRRAGNALLDLQQDSVTQSRLSQVFHGSPDAILIIRVSDNVVVDFNAGFTRLLGYERETAIGEADLDTTFWPNAAERAAVIERLRQDREVTDYETKLKKANGELVHVDISLRYIEIDNQLCVLCTGRDITKRISAEAALVETEEKFEKVFTESPDGMAIVRSTDGVITDLNDAFLERSEFTRAELIGQSIFSNNEYMKDGDPKGILNELTSAGRFTNHAVTFQTKSGNQVPSLISGSTLELSGESYVMVIAKDISKQQATEERLRRSEQRFRGIFENAPIGIILIDLEGKISQANRTAAEFLAYDEEDMAGIHVSRIVPSDERASLKEAIAGLSAGSLNSHQAERRVVCQNGLEIWTNFNIVLQKDSNDQGLYYIAQIADISEIKRGQQRMEQMAFYDTLTNLANRRLFQDRLNQAIQHSMRSEQISALLYLDLDNFKRVNDTLGHETGDNLLKEVALRLQNCVRKEDTVGRTGGDEFTILLNEVGTPTDAGLVAQKILNHLREPIHILGHPLIVTTSIGITVIPSDGHEPNELMRNADLAMYKAKERGRNNYQFYSEDLNTNAVKRLRMEYEIREAIERQEFELYYQPKVALDCHEIVGVESLIRWNHPERGLLTPDEFIGVAEDTGSIIDLGAWVIEEACKASRAFNEISSRPIQVAINISPRQFRDPNLITTVRRSLRESKIDPENIEIEITETMLMQDVAAAETTVMRLSEIGVNLAIDDFGTGYSSLNYLKRFPINTVKVDRSFVMDIPSNTDDMAITRAVIAMAHQLKMEVVAEGVETKAQLDFLDQHDCEYAQGWLFSKALPMQDILALIESNTGIIRLA